MSTRWLIVFFLAIPVEAQGDELVGSGGCPCVSPDSPSSDSAKSFKTRVRQVSLRWLNREGERQPTAYGLKLDSQGPVPGRRLVVLVHGFNSSPTHSSALLEPIRDLDLPCATFSYPNDQAISDSARLLSCELSRLAESHPRLQVTLLTFSMGGLVAREAVENPVLDPKNVDRLIMVASPNHGTAWARFAYATDIWEYCVRKDTPGVGEYFYRSLEDGFGEAEDDMTPGSAFLEELNARARNPRMRYSVLLGTGGKLSDQELQSARQAIERASARNRFTRWVGRGVERAAMAAHDEIIPGDGVVSVERGRLAGVADTELLPFDHCNVLHHPDRPAAQQLHAAIRKRLCETR